MQGSGPFPSLQAEGDRPVGGNTRPELAPEKFLPHGRLRNTPPERCRVEQSGSVADHNDAQAPTTRYTAVCDWAGTAHGKDPGFPHPTVFRCLWKTEVSMPLLNPNCSCPKARVRVSVPDHHPAAEPAPGYTLN